MARDRTPRDAFGRPLADDGRRASAPAAPSAAVGPAPHRDPPAPGAQRVARSPAPPPTDGPADGRAAGRGPGPAPDPAGAGPHADRRAGGADRRAGVYAHGIDGPDPERRWDALAAGGTLPAADTNPQGTVALVLGLLGFVLMPFLLSIAAIVVGTGAVRRADALPGAPGRSSASAGRVLGWIGLVMWTLGTLAIVLFVAATTSASP